MATHAPNLLRALEEMKLDQLKKRATKARSPGATVKEDFAFALLLNMAKKGHDVFSSSDLTTDAKQELAGNKRQCQAEWTVVCANADRCETWEDLKQALVTPVKTPTKARKAASLRDAVPTLFAAILDSGMTVSQLKGKASKEAMSKIATPHNKAEYVEGVLLMCAKRHINNDSRFGLDAIKAVVIKAAQDNLDSNESAALAEWHALVKFVSGIGFSSSPTGVENPPSFGSGSGPRQRPTSNRCATTTEVPVKNLASDFEAVGKSQNKSVSSSFNGLVTFLVLLALVYFYFQIIGGR